MFKIRLNYIFYWRRCIPNWLNETPLGKSDNNNTLFLSYIYGIVIVISLLFQISSRLPPNIPEFLHLDHKTFLRLHDISLSSLLCTRKHWSLMPHKDTEFQLLNREPFLDYSIYYSTPKQDSYHSLLVLSKTQSSLLIKCQLKLI